MGGALAPRLPWAIAAQRRLPHFGRADSLDKFAGARKVTTRIKSRKSA